MWVDAMNPSLAAAPKEVHKDRARLECIMNARLRNNASTSWFGFKRDCRDFVYQLFVQGEVDGAHPRNKDQILGKMASNGPWSGVHSVGAIVAARPRSVRYRPELGSRITDFLTGEAFVQYDPGRLCVTT